MLDCVYHLYVCQSYFWNSTWNPTVWSDNIPAHLAVILMLYRADVKSLTKLHATPKLITASTIEFRSTWCADTHTLASNKEKKNQGNWGRTVIHKHKKKVSLWTLCEVVSEKVKDQRLLRQLGKQKGTLLHGKRSFVFVFLFFGHDSAY